MVDYNTTQAFDYKLFRGLNKRDDENNLIYGQTPNAQNFEITKQTGLKKRLGWSKKVDDFNFGYRLENTYNYTTSTGDDYYLTASYPEMLLINPVDGFTTTIDSTLVNDGEPFVFEVSAGQALFVDGANAPRLITDGVVSTVSWPPTYSVQNNTLLDESNGATQSNPTTFGTDIGYPSVGAFFQNRAVLSGDELAPYRLYFSKLFDYDDFGTNSGSTINIAFWLDIDARSPITALKVINNQYLIIYCERELHVLTGLFPPGNGYPSPHITTRPLNREVGCPHWRLIADKGNNDQFFLANNGTVYNFQNADNFQDVKPKGITGKVYPLLDGLSRESLKRGRLVNHFIKSELHLWVPSANNISTPDRKLVYDYGDSSEEAEWGLDTGFGTDFQFVDSLVDRDTNRLLVVTRNSILETESGTTFDGSTIKLIYQLSTLDFGAPDSRKEIEKIIFFVKSSEATTLTFKHVWEDNTSGNDEISIPANEISSFGSAIYNQSNFTSTAGSPFTKVELTPENSRGKILKCTLINNEATDLFIHNIIFRYKVLGKT